MHRPIRRTAAAAALPIALVSLAMSLAPGLSHAADGLTATEVKIGMVNVQSGPAAGLGKGMRSGAEAWFKSVNAKGGVHGRQINMVVGDDGYEPDKAIDETLKMIEQQKVFSSSAMSARPRPTPCCPLSKRWTCP